MPDLNMEVLSNHCDIASEVIQKGLDFYAEYFSTLRFSCVEQADIVWPGLMDEADYFEHMFDPITDLAHHNMPIQLMADIAPIALLLVLSVWIYLYRSGASTRDMLFWGALSVSLPILGPLATLIHFRRSRNYPAKSPAQSAV